MYSKVNYTIVGIFVILFGAGLVGFTFWLAKYGIKNEYSIYKLQMKESISGLSKDSTVRLRGVDIGRVSKIRIDPDNIEHIEVFLKIRSDVPIKRDMTAHTEMLGITGLLSIEIDGGTNEAENLKPTADHIPVIHTSPSWFNKTTKGIGEMAEELSVVLEGGKKLLSEKNLQAFSAILENSEKASAKFAGTLDEFESTMKTYKEAAVKLNESIAVISKDFKKITKKSLPALDSLEKAASDFNRLTLEAEKSLNRGDYNIKEVFAPMLIDISILTEQLTDLSRELQNNPNGLLFKSRKRRRGPGE